MYWPKYIGNVLFLFFREHHKLCSVLFFLFPVELSQNSPNMEPNSIKSGPWDLLGAPRAPLERGVVLRTPLVSISTRFWNPFGIHGGGSLQTFFLDLVFVGRFFEPSRGSPLPHQRRVGGMSAAPLGRKEKHTWAQIVVRSRKENTLWRNLCFKGPVGEGID